MESGLASLIVLSRFRGFAAAIGQMRHRFPAAQIGVVDIHRGAPGHGLKAHARTVSRKRLDNVVLPTTDLSKAEIQANEHQEGMRKFVLKRGLDVARARRRHGVTTRRPYARQHRHAGTATQSAPKVTGLEIEAMLANKDVGFVHKGQEVEIKVEAFTFTRYGLLHGVVASVSQDVVTPQDSSVDARGSRKDDSDAESDEKERQSRQPTYVAHVALAATGIQTENGFAPLEPGIAVTAEIKTGRRSVISYLLSPLIRFKQEGLRER
ncbi:HlyD family secretion protein [Methylocapsa sp. S129]|uniref:HlyD family efflux transporter periplasmic adaptor subunit n=1 Tax=Methylocapsa sp. S129 TaxID=1641869 RepID=UPI001AEE2CA9|nr:HlyD family secretion protein [Methylocapsa sp. S129]